MNFDYDSYFKDVVCGSPDSLMQDDAVPSPLQQKMDQLRKQMEQLSQQLHQRDQRIQPENQHEIMQELHQKLNTSNQKAQQLYSYRLNLIKTQRQQEQQKIESLTQKKSLHIQAMIETLEKMIAIPGERTPRKICLENKLKKYQLIESQFAIKVQENLKEIDQEMHAIEDEVKESVQDKAKIWAVSLGNRHLTSVKEWQEGKLNEQNEFIGQIQDQVDAILNLLPENGLKRKRDLDKQNTCQNKKIAISIDAQKQPKAIAVMQEKQIGCFMRDEPRSDLPQIDLDEDDFWKRHVDIQEEGLEEEGTKDSDLINYGW